MIARPVSKADCHNFWSMPGSAHNELIYFTYVLLLSNADKTVDKNRSNFTNIVDVSLASGIKYYFTYKQATTTKLLQQPPLLLLPLTTTTSTSIRQTCICHISVGGLRCLWQIHRGMGNCPPSQLVLTNLISNKNVHNCCYKNMHQT